VKQNALYRFSTSKFHSNVGPVFLNRATWNRKLPRHSIGAARNKSQLAVFRGPVSRTPYRGLSARFSGNRLRLVTSQRCLLAVNGVFSCIAASRLYPSWSLLLSPLILTGRRGSCSLRDRGNSDSTGKLGRWQDKLTESAPIRPFIFLRTVDSNCADEYGSNGRADASGKIPVNPAQLPIPYQLDSEPTSAQAHL
jgi:hypothetical protein